MADTIRLRGGTAAEWTSANPILASREVGVETDTRRLKFGNGTSTWEQLPYAFEGGFSGDDFIAAVRAQVEAALAAGDNITITTAGSGASRTFSLAAADGEGAAATDLSYNAPTRLLSSSTGADVTLPLATASAAGLQSDEDYTLVRSAVQPGQNPAATVFTIVDGGSVAINPANGALQVWTLGASRTPTATFAEGSSTTIHITGNGFSVNWTTAAITWLSGTAPTLAPSGITPVTLYRVGSVIYGGSPVDTSELGAGPAIISGTAALGTAAIASGASAAAVTVAATGVLPSHVIDWGFGVNPNTVTGYSGAATTGSLAILPYPATDSVNFVVSNPTASSITPGPMSLNWKVHALPAPPPPPPPLSGFPVPTLYLPLEADLLDASSNSWTNANTASPPVIDAGEATPIGTGAADFTGSSSQYLEYADNILLNPGASDFFIALWLKVRTTGRTTDYPMAVTKGSFQSSSGAWNILYNLFDAIAVSFGSGNPWNETLFSGSGNPAGNAWGNIIVQRAGNTMTMYHGGSSVDTRDVTGVDFTSTHVFRVGAASAGATLDPWNGWLRDVVYCKGSTLTTDQITDLQTSSYGDLL